MMATMVIFLGLVMPQGGQAEEARRITAFDILPGWLHYPGLNAQAEVGFEFMEHQDFYKGFSTEFMTLKQVVGIRYGYIQGMSKSWSAHEFGFSIPMSRLEDAGIKLNLPAFLRGAGIHASLGLSYKNGMNVLTGQVGLVLIGGGI